MTHSTLRDVIDKPGAILKVWPASGGGPLRHGRGCAFWRGSDGYSVAIDAQRNVWHDHVTQQGGGILDLIQVATDCDRRAATSWALQFFGVADAKLTAAERSRYRADRARRELEQVRVAAAIDDLRERRREQLHCRTLARQVLASQGPDAPAGVDAMYVIYRADVLLDRIEAEIDRLRALVQVTWRVAA